MDKKEYEIVKKRYQNIYDELKELEIEVVDEKEVIELFSGYMETRLVPFQEQLNKLETTEK